MSKYKVREIELFLDGETKTFKKERVSGKILRKIFSLNKRMEGYIEERTSNLKKEGYKGKDLEEKLTSALLSDFGYFDEAAEIVTESFGKQFSVDDIFEGMDADELPEKLQFYFDNAMSNEEDVGEDTEGFLDKEKETEKD